MDDDHDPAEVEEVVSVLWEFHDLINVVFDYYCATSAGEDLTQMGLNSFSQFVSDCSLSHKRSR